MVAKVNELKNDATQLFLKKDFSKAVESYDQAIKLLPDASDERLDLMQKKAGCFMSQKK